MMSKKIKIVTALVLILIAIVSFLVSTNRTNAPAIKKSGNSTKNTDDNASVVAPKFNTSAHSIHEPASIWVVVNKTRPLDPISYAPTDLVNVGGSQQIRNEAASAFKNLQEAAKNAGLTIVAMSGYRSYGTQVGVYNSEVKRFGQAKADSESARAGYSEHQTGWAVDVGGGGCGIEDCFGNTAEGKWLAAHAFEYGFIIRYTADKQAVTGYRAEPWHIRYIGTELSIEMHKNGITTLEEFFGLPAAPSYK